MSAKLKTMRHCRKCHHRVLDVCMMYVEFQKECDDFHPKATRKELRKWKKKHVI